jgi:transcription elongation GreA/GreB family factor
MTKSKKEEFLKLINLEIGKVGISTEKTSAGDKYHSESAAELAQEFLLNLKKLRDEVENTNDEKSDIAASVSYLELSYETGERVKFYLVEKNALLPGILLITTSSPIGKEVRDKKEGDRFSYEIKSHGQTKTFAGKIDKIE